MVNSGLKRLRQRRYCWLRPWQWFFWWARVNRVGYSANKAQWSHVDPASQFLRQHRYSIASHLCCIRFSDNRRSYSGQSEVRDIRQREGHGPLFICRCKTHHVPGSNVPDAPYPKLECPRRTISKARMSQTHHIPGSNVPDAPYPRLECPRRTISKARMSQTYHIPGSNVPDAPYPRLECPRRTISKARMSQTHHIPGSNVPEKSTPLSIIILSK